MTSFIFFLGLLATLTSCNSGGDGFSSLEDPTNNSNQANSGDGVTNVVILNFSPTGDPVVIKSTDTQPFSISAAGNPPVTYSWEISPGSTIAACNNQPTCSISGTDFTPGAYVLKVTAIDQLATTDSHSFNIVINGKPTLTTNNPSNASTTKMSCSTNKNFDLSVSDLNFSNPGQTYTIQ